MAKNTNETAYSLGIDIGSTTVKLAVIDKDARLVFGKYSRHYSNIQETLHTLFTDAQNALPGAVFTAAITGSGGLTISNWIGAGFVQEVIAVTEAVGVIAPKTDVAVEIGGEDAKIIYFKGMPEQRMNGICAGGTGSFIDQMASLLQTDASGLNELARDYNVIYPIAARCGVFAKSDIQPLINEGAAKQDIAASVFQAVVSQTISGLACGKPIRGNVAFLGGPLHFLPELRNRFAQVLKLTAEQVIMPENSHLFAAIGAALSVKSDKLYTFAKLIDNLLNNKTISFEINRLAPLFKTRAEYDGFTIRHDQKSVAKRDLSTYKGDAFLGIDAGSTTSKLVLISETGELLYSFYSGNQGTPLKIIIHALKEIYDSLPVGVNIASSCVTGYGEALCKEAIGVDIGEIETVAHYKAAAFFEPDVDFILDIGGQDMKCIRIKNGVIDNVLLNEACSAGCGSFIETFAKSLNYDAKSFAKVALFSENPIDLGSRCTVFMNSRVKQAQKEGAHVSDIAAGLAYSVIKNALQKVIKITDPAEMGEKIVVQGGTFYNDAVLRAFELIAEREAIRPDIAGLMGAFGAAVIAMERYANTKSTLFSRSELESLSVSSTMTRCRKCENNCLLTVNSFSGGKKYISGNRCERGAGKEKTDTGIPNLFDYKSKLLFGRESLPKEAAKRGVIGIPRVLNMYENYPFWHEFFTELSYSVLLSPQSSRSLYESGMDSMPSESVCFPAKLAHGHVMSLIKSGVKTIFYPSVSFEQKDIAGADSSFNCPIVTSYPENIKNNVEDLISESVDFIHPFLNFNDKPSMLKQLRAAFPDIKKTEMSAAFYKAWLAFDKFKGDMRKAGDTAVKYVRDNNIIGIVLAGRPYHVDKEVNHGIPEMITSYGAAVLTEDSVSHLGLDKALRERPLMVRDQWAYHSRLYAAACFVREERGFELIQLNSFGCGLDAVTTDEVKELLDEYGRIYTLLKIDEVTNLGSARIRVRSLFAALDERARKGQKPAFVSPRPERMEFTSEMKARHTILTPQMSPIHFDFVAEAFSLSGYNMVVMPAIDKESVDVGLKYVNNDACYPAVIVVGQLLKALKSGDYDERNVSLVISQTGGGCRASNYIGFIRKALARAGYKDIPVISVSASALEKNEGWKYSPKMLIRALQGLIYGDLFMRVLYATRPYEKIKGSADALHEKWALTCLKSLKKADSKTFKANIAAIVAEFDELPLLNVKKPRVGVVGEILVKFHPTANNDVVTLLEAEGAEAVVPDLLDFFLYSLYNADFKHKNLGGKLTSKLTSDAVIAFIEAYRKPLHVALEQSRRFSPPTHIRELAKMAEPIVSLGNQTGEGWFLTAEMVELIHFGAQNIVCAQPFACLPNHVTGKGIIKELRNRYPMANIVAVDYDPGASEVNQLNRIKLMLSAAAKNLEIPENAENPEKTVATYEYV
ncbi:2-hydroxyglutaryl-CoA dehydratase [Clostridia bacterium]|nr:2-hydroxyglutaryl-CoA dehydratase [Clostridia bacterium]